MSFRSRGRRQAYCLVPMMKVKAKHISLEICLFANIPIHFFFDPKSSFMRGSDCAISWIDEKNQSDIVTHPKLWGCYVTKAGLRLTNSCSWAPLLSHVL